MCAFCTGISTSITKGNSYFKKSRYGEGRNRKWTGRVRLRRPDVICDAKTRDRLSGTEGGSQAETRVWVGN